ncbi:MAG: hypothetical protein ABJB03_10480 [Rhodoglobus sp.]
MTSRARRILGLALAVVLVVAVVVVVLIGRGSLGGSTQGGLGPQASLTVVNGVIGSEKKPFFEDPEVKAIFATNGLDVHVVTAGSRQIATTVDLSAVDFVFPSSAPAAQKIKLAAKSATLYSPFYSPMAIASFLPIAKLLEGPGITSQDADGTWHFNLRAYLDVVENGTRWTDLPGANTAYPNSRSILVSSTDVRQSNSAAMYLSMASYVLNGQNVVSDPASQDAIISELGDLFLHQGFSAASSEEPFDDYLSQGIGSKPLVMIYEAQFLGQEMSETGKSAITKDMVLMYPDPTVLSKHTVVALTGPGNQVGQLLESDPDLQRLAAIYGFRPADSSVFSKALTDHGLAVPPVPVDVVDPPSYEVLESMIVAISQRYENPEAGDLVAPDPPAPDPTPTP